MEHNKSVWWHYSFDVICQSLAIKLVLHGHIVCLCSQLSLH